ncbi:hypothetical protein IW262DRAFT_509413 [Armillaria fumosa]|nr:hypothetical protein IW262DRAFT_509413 [Armillaria fumosa]
MRVAWGPPFRFGLFLAIGDEDAHRDHGCYDRYTPPCNVPYRTIYVFPVERPDAASAVQIVPLLRGHTARSLRYPEPWFIKSTGAAGATWPPSPILAFQDALRLETLTLAQWNKSAITRLFQSPWNQITAVSNDGTNPGGVTVFRCAKRAIAAVVVAWCSPKKLGIEFCRHESPITLDVVNRSKASRDFTTSIIQSLLVLSLRIRHHSQGQEAVVLLGLTEVGSCGDAAIDRCIFKGSQVGGILNFCSETRISAHVRKTSGSIFTCRDYEDER